MLERDGSIRIEVLEEAHDGIDCESLRESLVEGVVSRTRERGISGRQRGIKLMHEGQMVSLLNKKMKCK